MHNRNFGFAESQARLARPLANVPRRFSWVRALAMITLAFLCGLVWCLVGVVAYWVLS